MQMHEYYRRLRHALRAFRASPDGNVVLTFAVALIPLIGFVGAAVDYSRGNSDKAALQAALDATALILSKNAGSLTQSQMTQQATNDFNALFTRTDVSGLTLTPTYTTSGGSQLLLTATGTVPTTFMKVMGVSTMTISTSSTVRWGNSRLRVALVLDNTGSMASSGKMTALKSAAKNLLTQLKNAATQNGDVYVSIIPFSKDVNADPVNYNQTWVKWSGATDTWDENNGTCTSYSGHSTPQTKSACLNKNGHWTADNHNTWNGCVTDRDQSYDTTNTAPVTGTPATLFPAEQYASCPVPLMGLSYDWTALSNKIDAMQPNGNTNQAIGLQWGFQSLTSAPFTIPPLDPNYQYNQVIILLTDGLNTQDRWYLDQPSIDARQKITCDNVKAAGITVYTVQVNTSGDPTSTLLQNCASSSDKFFLLTSSTQIVTTFDQIGTALSRLRVAK
ncbi:MAG: VWA domain-containing protein [Xanthobacteraceae bacterium]